MSGSGGQGVGGGGGQGGPPIPETIDRYIVTRRIGHGGQGEVYLAHDPNLEIDVAVKVLHSDYRTEEFIERFKVEARTSVRLNNRNIVRVYEFNAAYPYLVMEYCGDGDLNHIIKTRERLSVSRSLGYVREITEALIAAHEHDPPILHRDMKPQNVMFARGVPKVADFGLAKMLGSATSGLTRTRGMMGTIGYASPEQLKDASNVDARADLWSVGVIAYELLTFSRPFDKPGDDFVNVAIKVRMEPPADPPFELPKPIWEFLEKALQKNPDERFSSAREMVQALDGALAAVPNPDELMLPPAAAMGEIDRMAAEAAAAMSSGSTDAANKLISKMRSADPDHSLPRYWQKHVRAIQEFESSQQSPDGGQQAEAEFLESRLNSIRSLLQKREYRDARRLVGELLIKDPDNSLVQKYIQRINDEESLLSDTLNKAHEDADAARKQGDAERICNIWKEAAERFPEHPDIEAELAVAQREFNLKRRQTDRAEVDVEVRQKVESGALDAAVAAWDAYLLKHPEDADAASNRAALKEKATAEAREKRLRDVRAAAVQAAGPAEALTIWEGCLAADPDSDEARRKVQELRAELARGARDVARQEVAGRAGKFAVDGDHHAALGLWNGFLGEHPGDEEASRQVAALERAIAQQRRAALLRGFKEEVDRVESKVGSGRYAGLENTPAVMAQAVLAAKGAAEKADSDLEQAAKALAGATGQAEAALVESLRARRQELLGSLDEAREVLDSGEAGESAPGAAELRSALEGGLAALCEARPSDGPGDPLAPLARVATTLNSAIEGFSRRRQAAIDEARARAEAAIVQAEEELAAAGDDGMRERLAGLLEQTESRSTERLDAVAVEANAMIAESTTRRIGASWQARGALAALRARAIELWRRSHEPELEQLVFKIGKAFEAPTAGERPGQDGMAELAAALREELEGLTRRQGSRTQDAAGRFKQALSAWDAVAGRADGEIGKQGEASKSSGQRALTDGRLAELVARTAELEGLARRAGLESVWAGHCDAILSIEESDGAQESAELLARYRKAVAAGRPDELAALGPDLEKAAGAASPGKGDQGSRGKAIPVPKIDGRTRKYNERLQADAVERFDEVVARYEKAASGKRKGVPAELIEEVKRAQGRMLRAPSPWPRVLPPVIAAIVMLAAAAWISGLFKPDETYPVTLISSSGGVQVQGVSRDGSSVAGLPSEWMNVSEQGVRWELAPGSYSVTTPGGEVSFDVPRQGSVVLSPNRTDYRKELLQELDLSGLVE